MTVGSPAFEQSPEKPSFWDKLTTKQRIAYIASSVLMTFGLIAWYDSQSQSKVQAIEPTHGGKNVPSGEYTNIPPQPQAAEVQFHPSPVEIKFIEVTKNKEKIAQGIEDSISFWEAQGVKDAGSLRKREINVQDNWFINNAYYEGNSIWIILNTSNPSVKSASAHEAYHLFGLAVEDMPGFIEGPAVLTQMLLYGGSSQGPDIPLASGKEPTRPFLCESGKFQGKTPQEWIANYDKAGLAAKEIGLPFWVYLTKRYNSWRETNGFQSETLAPADALRGWVEDYHPGYWVELQNKYPVLFCSP